VSIDTVKNWAKQGMPGKPGAYDLCEIIPWMRKRFGEKTSGDPLLDAEVDSPGLERYRLAKAALAELDLAERNRTLLPLEEGRAALSRWASIIRRLGEQLGKRFGPDATTAVNDAILECQHVVDHDLAAIDGEHATG
jgi:phage terminase Nu1 subunit (DNA packaging protein)